MHECLRYVVSHTLSISLIKLLVYVGTYLTPQRVVHMPSITVWFKLLHPHTLTQGSATSHSDMLSETELLDCAVPFPLHLLPSDFEKWVLPSLAAGEKVVADLRT